MRPMTFVLVETEAADACFSVEAKAADDFHLLIETKPAFTDDPFVLCILHLYHGRGTCTADA